MASGLFAGIRDANSKGGGDYLDTGLHTLRLLKMTTKVTRKKADAVIFNVEILETSNPKYPKGAKSTIFIQARVDTNWLGDVKNVLLAVLGSVMGEAVGEDAVDEEIVENACAGDGTSLAGTVFKCQAFGVPTKKGGTFTKYQCDPVFDYEGA